MGYLELLIAAVDEAIHQANTIRFRSSNSNSCGSKPSRNTATASILKLIVKSQYDLFKSCAIVYNTVYDKGVRFTFYFDVVLEFV